MSTSATKGQVSSRSTTVPMDSRWSTGTNARPRSMSSEDCLQSLWIDLLDQIEWPSVECLNESSERPLANALKQGYRDDDGLVLESDADEQILLTIPFQQVVKVHSLGLKAPSDSGPKKVKLFTNRASLGFSEATDGLVPQQEIVFLPDQLDGTPVPLKYVKFQGVRSLTIFVESNQEDEDTTKVQKIVLLGFTVETTDMKALKKVDDHQH